MEGDGKSKNILYRPKRLKKFMQTRMKTKKLQKIQRLTLLYTIFPLSYTFYRLQMVPLPHTLFRTLYPF